MKKSTKKSCKSKKVIELMNMRSSRIVYKNDVRVDRMSGLGNPFKGDRNIVCDEYELWFAERVEKRDNQRFNQDLEFIINLLEKYRKVKLFCWCVPKRCHSETIKRFLEQI